MRVFCHFVTSFSYFCNSHQDPSSTVLNVVELLDALARDPQEKCVAVVNRTGVVWIYTYHGNKSLFSGGMAVSRYLPKKVVLNEKNNN